MALGEFALNMVVELLGLAIDKGVSFGSMDFFDRRRITRRVEDATAEVIQPLLPFLTREGISEDRQRILLQTCVAELRPLTDQPEALFRGSLNGQKIFENLYSERKLPTVILEEGLGDTYALVCPRIATLLCQIPAAVKAWEAEAWAEGYRRLEEIARELRSLFVRVDEMATLPSREADEILSIVRRAMAQKVGLELDLTGLRADRPYSGKFDDFFVHPEISFRNKEAPNERSVVGSEVESLETFIRPASRVIIIGPPGAGKSTWSKWVQREALTDRWAGIIVRKELRQLSAGLLPSLHELVRNAAGRHFAEELSAVRIGNWLAGNKVLFVLDGFDEIRPGDRDTVHEWIVSLVTASRSCPFVLTSRPLTTNHLDAFGEMWTRWTIEPFDNGRVLEYIERWYKSAPLISESERDVNAEALAQVWQKDPTIGPLTGNPLLLSTLLMVHYLDGSLPSGRSQLYRRYVDGMLGLWDDRRQVSATAVPLTIGQKRQIIRGLALYMFLTDQDQIEESEALQWMTDTLADQKLLLSAEDSMAVLMERSGLIIGPGIYSFAHKSIAEYLVAEAVLQGDQRDEHGHRIDRFRLFEFRTTDRWNTVVFLWAGLAPSTDLESFVDRCSESGDLDLALGILLDQHARFTFEIQRRLIKRAFTDLQTSEFYNRLLVDNGRWISAEPDEWRKEGALDIPSFRLRGLADNVHFFDLISKAVEDGVLMWADAEDVDGPLRDLLWMFCMRGAKTADEWMLYLKEQVPNSAPERRWLLWSAFYVFHRSALGKTRLDLAEAVKIFKEVRPDYTGFVPFALMSAALRAPSWEVFSSIASVLPRSGEGRLDLNLLLGSQEWSNGFDKTGDLIDRFVEDLDSFVTQGLALGKAEDGELHLYLEMLRSERQALVRTSEYSRKSGSDSR
jgi:hypothetical protein